MATLVIKWQTRETNAAHAEKKEDDMPASEQRSRQESVEEFRETIASERRPRWVTSLCRGRHRAVEPRENERSVEERG